MFKRSFLISLIRTLTIESALKNTSGNSKAEIESILNLEKRIANEEDDEFTPLKEVIKEMLTESMDEPFNLSIYIYGLTLATKSEEMSKEILTVTDLEHASEELKILRKSNIKEMKLIRLRAGMAYNTKFIKNNELNYEEMSKFVTDVKEMIDKNNPSNSEEEDTIMSINASTAIDSNDKSTKRVGLSDIFKTIKAEASPLGVWKTHLTGINKMLQGGLRSGHMVFINGIQYSFKSGMALSLITSLALLNPPKESKRPGKPTILILNLEDSLVKTMGDLYGFLKVWDGPIDERINLEDIDPDEAEEFILSTFEKTGYDVQFHRIDSSNYTYAKLFAFINKLEAEGASVRAVMIDYIANITKTGCSKTGALGADSRELVRRIRNFMQARDILCISPHQLSSGGKSLLRDGLPAAELVPRVLGNGFTADSSQIDQELDVETALHIVRKDGRDFLMMGCGKHKLNSVIEDKKDLIFVTEFPSNGNKISPDIHGTERCFHTLDEAINNKKEEEAEESYY